MGVARLGSIFHIQLNSYIGQIYSHTRMGIHTHMGEPRDARDTHMGSPYAYGQPIRVWAKKNCPYAYGQPIRVWDSPYAYGKNTCMERNTSNITAAIARLERQHIGCFSHTLQLNVQKALNLPVMSRAIARGKRLVSHFHSSVKSTNVLRQKQRDLKHTEHKLIQVNLYFNHNNINNFILSL